MPVLTMPAEGSVVWYPWISSIHSAVTTDGLVLATPSDGRGIILTGPAWTSGRSFSYGNKDGLFFINGFADASGVATSGGVVQSYTKLFGAGTVTKTGPGNMDAFWASIAHSGPDEVGLFIGDVTAKAGGSGGRLWGAHFVLTAELAADMRGLVTELTPQVDVSAKSTFGVWSRNTSDTFPVNALLRTSGNAVRHIACYSDAAATALIFDVDQAGNVSAAGAVTPKANGTIDVGSTALRYRQLHANNVELNAADSAGVSVGLSMTNRATAPTRANTNGGTLYIENGRLKYQGTGGNGTTPVTVALSGGVPTLTVQAGAGSGASASLASPGNDETGIVTVTLGTSPAVGQQVRVAFASALAATPRGINITPASAASASALPYITSIGTTGFTIATANAPTGSLVYSYRVTE